MNNRRSQRSSFFSKNAEAMLNSSNLNNFLFNNMMASSLNESDLRRERRKDEITRALENQGKKIILI